MPKKIAIEILCVWCISIIGMVLFFTGATLYSSHIKAPVSVLMHAGIICMFAGFLYGFYMVFRDMIDNGV